MRVLLDTNVLLRGAELNHPHHPAAMTAVGSLVGAGRQLCISSQTIYEFLAVATRAVADRGLGMKQVNADAALSDLTSGIETLFDSAQVVQELRRLAIAHSIIGKSIHDARLVATMVVNGISHILTFNGSDFARFGQVSVIDPSTISTQSNP